MVSLSAVMENNLNRNSHFNNYYLNHDLAEVVDGYLTFEEREFVGQSNHRALTALRKEIDRIGTYLDENLREVPPVPLKPIRDQQRLDFATQKPSRVTEGIKRALKTVQIFHPSSFRFTEIPQDRATLAETLERIYRTHQLEVKEPMYLSFFHLIKPTYLNLQKPADIDFVRTFLNDPAHFTDEVISHFRSRILSLHTKPANQMHEFPIEIVQYDWLTMDDLFKMLRIALDKQSYPCIEAIVKHPNFTRARESDPEFRKRCEEFFRIIVEKNDPYSLFIFFQDRKFYRFMPKECLVSAMRYAVENNKVYSLGGFLDFPELLSPLNIEDWTRILLEGNSSQIFDVIKGRFHYFANWTHDTRCEIINRLLQNPKMVECLLKSPLFVKDFTNEDYSRMAMNAFRHPFPQTLILLLNLNPPLLDTAYKVEGMISFMAQHGEEKFFEKHFLPGVYPLHSRLIFDCVYFSLTNKDPGPLLLLLHKFGDSYILLSPLLNSIQHRVEEILNTALANENVQLLHRMFSSSNVSRFIRTSKMKEAIEIASKKENRNCYLYLIRACETKPSELTKVLGEMISSALREKNWSIIHRILSDQAFARLIPDETLIEFAREAFKDPYCLKLLHDYGKILFEERIASLKALSPSELNRIEKLISEKKS